MRVKKDVPVDVKAFIGGVILDEAETKDLEFLAGMLLVTPGRYEQALALMEILSLPVPDPKMRH